MHCTTEDLGLASAMTMAMSDVHFILASSVLAVTWWLLRRYGVLRMFSAGGRNELPLPPGPPDWPIVGNLFQIDFRPHNFVHTVNGLRERYGPIFKLRLGRRTFVIVTSAELIHEALVKRGALFATRPPDGPVRRLFTADKTNVNSATYSPLWRGLRRNLTTGIVSAPRVRQYAAIRDRAVEQHLARVRDEFQGTGAVHVIDRCRVTIAGILLCMCFGARLTEGKVQEVMDVLKEVSMMMFPSLPESFPLLSPLLKRQVMAARRVRARQLDCLMPLVAARREFVENNGTQTTTAAEQMEMVIPAGGAYVDSLFELETPPEKEEVKEECRPRRLSDEEIVTLCNEVVFGGTDTTTAGLEWAMMHLVLDLEAQDRLYHEVVGGDHEAGGGIEEARLDAMPFLQAVVKETLRLHPPTNFLLSHAVTEETELGGYRVPVDAVMEFYTKWVPRDPEAWEDPGEWRPERFLDGGEGADDVGLRMLPFGAGRRVCPGAALGTLHMKVMIAAMVREFRWVPVPGDAPPDPAETFAFSVVMKNSLEAAIVERKPRVVN